MAIRQRARGTAREGAGECFRGRPSLAARGECQPLAAPPRGGSPTTAAPRDGRAGLGPRGAHAGLLERAEAREALAARRGAPGLPTEDRARRDVEHLRELQPAETHALAQRADGVGRRATAGAVTTPPRRAGRGARSETSHPGLEPCDDLPVLPCLTAQRGELLLQRAQPQPRLLHLAQAV